MSSFVIDKLSYVRVGALVAGIAKGTRGTSRELWIYDDEKRRNMKGLDYVEKFAQCYDLIVESVRKQYADSHDSYSDPETYRDDADILDKYYDDYKRYFKYGELVVNDTMALMDVIWNITYFSRSVNYQIEDPVCNQIVMEWFNTVIAKLVQIADLKDDNDRNQWGHFNLDLDKEKALN